MRLEGLLDETIVCFTSDHGDMLGNHHMAAKRVFYEASANVPMILMGTKDDPRLGEGRVDDRLVGLQDVMPTLLELCGIPVPESVDGLSMLAATKRDFLYGECGEDDHATRMIREGRHKLIYYPVGNHFQLFDLEADPLELRDLAADPAHGELRRRLAERLGGELYGGDEAWLEGREWTGKADKPYHWAPHRSLNSQRGDGWPTPPVVDIPQVEWVRERTAEARPEPE